MKRKTAVCLICVILGLLAAALTIAACFRNMLERINYVDPETTPTLSQEELDAYLATDETSFLPPATEFPEVEFEDHDTQISGSNIVNILLIGQDRKDGQIRARSDTILLCTLHKSEKVLTMTSFLRDLYVRIPGYKNNRLNAAYAAGGMKLLNQTLETNFGIQVDGNIEVDFTQFAQIIDLMDGVTITLRQDEADAINDSVPGNLTEGQQHLNGQQALVYTRLRKLDSDGDFSRTNRQRKLLAALLEAYKDAGISTILSLLDAILPMITTDLTKTDILAYAKELILLFPELEIRSQCIPAEGTYSYKTIRNMAVLVADMDAARSLLEQTLMDTGN